SATSIRNCSAPPYPYLPKDTDLAGSDFTDFDLIAAQRPAPRPSASVTGKTDTSGAAQYASPAAVGDYPTSQTFTLTATVTDANQQQVSGSTSVIVHKASVYAGLKPQKYVGTAGQVQSVDVRTVQSGGDAAPNTGFSATVYLRTWTTAKQRDADGSERYVSTPNDTQVDKRDLSSDGSGKATLAFTPAKGGQYRIVVTGRDAAG